MLHIPLLIGEKLFQISLKNELVYAALFLVSGELSKHGIADSFFNIFSIIAGALFIAPVVYTFIIDFMNLDIVWKKITQLDNANYLFNEKDILRIWLVFFVMLFIGFAV